MSSTLPVLAACLAAASVGLILMGFVMLLRRDPVRVRLTEYGGRPPSLEQLELELPFKDRVLRPIFYSLSRIIMRKTPQATLERMRKELVLAGSPGNMDVSDFLGVKGLAAVGFAGLGVLAVSGRMPLPLALLVAAGAAMFGFSAPSFWLRSRIAKRRKEITRALPDALDLLVISVEAGLGFDAAIQKVAEKWNNQLTREFGRALSEMRVGATRRDALRGIVERTDTPDVATFVSAIVQADQLGVSIGRVLHVQADQMRIKRRQRAEELAHKAPIKMLFPMILLIFPAMYIIVLGPAVPQIVKGLGGR